MTTVPFGSKQSAGAIAMAMRKDEHAPLSAMIEIADRCNETCVHCYQIQGQKGELPTDDWRRILDELAGLGVLFLTISGGEATLRHDFLELVAYARKLRFAVKIYTNGITMTRELAQALGDLAVQEVQISLYSPRADVHDWVTRVPGSWEKTVAAARYLREAKVAVLLKTPVMTINESDLDEYVALTQSLGTDYAFDPHLDPREDGDRETERLRIRADQLERMWSDPRLSTIGTRAKPLPTPKLDKSVCGACSGNVHIEANGEMRPCTQLGVAVGHAVRDGVAHAWTHNQAGRMIRALEWRDLHGCRDCDIQPQCGRCFASARVESGDALGPYPSACRRARLLHQVASNTRWPVVAEPGRDPDVGPYRIEGETLRAIDDVITDEDRARAAELGWTRAIASSSPSDDEIVPGTLVQIRRPGKKTARMEAVPGTPARD